MHVSRENASNYWYLVFYMKDERASMPLMAVANINEMIDTARYDDTHFTSSDYLYLPSTALLHIELIYMLYILQRKALPYIFILMGSSW